MTGKLEGLISSHPPAGTPASTPGAEPRLRWWREVAIIAVFYFLYSLVRDLHGTNQRASATALANAHRIVAMERALHVFREQALQDVFIRQRWFMEFWDGYYGTAHALAVVAALLLLFFRYPNRYRLWRNVLAFSTAFALVGFAFFPLLPPRLLGAPYHFVDSLDVIGGIWTFHGGAISQVSNQLAAMPSLHTAWSAWVTLALFPVVKSRKLRTALALYPAATIFCIVITANHYFADAFGGLVVLGASYLIAKKCSPAAERFWGRVRSSPRRTALSPTT